MNFSVVSRSALRSGLLLAAAGLAAATVPASAQQRQNETRAEEPAKEPDKPITQQDVGAKDVALTPLSDLNIKRGEIPPLLIAAQDDPYDLTGMARCQQIAAAIGELDAVLGDDIDIPQESRQRISAGRAAQEALGSFIPFRGLIREVSGANAQQRKIQTAILAGTARRSFLKGIGQQRGCRYPARSTTPQILAQLEAEADAAERARNQPQPAQQPARGQNGKPRTVSQPVVQPTRR